MMLSAERNRELRRLLFEHGSFRVSAEAKRFGVSEETIRRDIKRLAEEGLAEAVFGGAVLKPSAHLAAFLLPVGKRHLVEEGAKDAIGLAAAELVSPGDVLVIDAGTTTLAMARHLVRHANLTVITNSLPVAQVCAEIPSCSTYVVGGKIAPGSLSTIGPEAERDLMQFTADWAFLGAAAIDVDGGFTSADPYEAQVKRAMIKAARKAVVLADHTKFGTRRFAAFARAGDIARVITTGACPAEARAWLEAAGVALTFCNPDREAISA
jgi:DeoR/GlpR family transcriptional regulator of sugar metabolism